MTYILNFGSENLTAPKEISTCRGCAMSSLYRFCSKIDGAPVCVMKEAGFDCVIIETKFSGDSSYTVDEK